MLFFEFETFVITGGVYSISSRVGVKGILRAFGRAHYVYFHIVRIKSLICDREVTQRPSRSHFAG